MRKTVFDVRREVGVITSIARFHRNKQEAEFTLNTYDSRVVNWTVMKMYLNGEL